MKILSLSEQFLTEGFINNLRSRARRLQREGHSVVCPQCQRWHRFLLVSTARWSSSNSDQGAICQSARRSLLGNSAYRVSGTPQCLLVSAEWGTSPCMKHSHRAAVKSLLRQNDQSQDSGTLASSFPRLNALELLLFGISEEARVSGQPTIYP